jgi:hypothetical protein
MRLMGALGDRHVLRHLAQQGAERLAMAVAAGLTGRSGDVVHMNAVTGDAWDEPCFRIALDLSMTWTPLIFGMARSVRIRSGLWCFTLRSASWPLQA